MKKFNDTGQCVPSKHYMVNILSKFEKIKEFITIGEYFAINRPRQFGKTTTLSAISRYYADSDEYMVIRLSFEGIGDDIFKEEGKFCKGFVEMLTEKLEKKYSQFTNLLKSKASETVSFKKLSLVITEIINNIHKKVILIIDEVDKSSNNQLFINFIALLRDKYLSQNDAEDFTFHCVILAGVHDVKTLKLKIRPDGDTKLNSPWNIAADFDVDMTFNPQEIGTMLVDYSQDKKIEMDIPVIAGRIHYYTSGYPYLVSKMCKVIDEILLPHTQQTDWKINDVDNAAKYLVRENYSTTLFEDLVKNLENNADLYELIFSIVINGSSIKMNIYNPIINIAIVYGIIHKNHEFCAIHNRIFEQLIYNYMASKMELKRNFENYILPSEYIVNNQLIMKNVLKKFQQFMKENYSRKDSNFLEREGRLLFISYLKPIINGKGYDFKEPVVGDERRTDLVITYGDKRYVIELKLWRGEEYHQRGLQQLSDYLDLYNLKEGFLLIYDFRKEKEYKDQTIQFADKQIFAVWV